MNRRAIHVCFFFFIIAYGLSALGAMPSDKESDPLKQVTSSFPGSIELKRKGRLLEFCPDNTCDGFEASGDFYVTTLKDFAYLYIYFFSDYYVLQDWRNQAESGNVAKPVLSKPEYRNCKNESGLEAARCVLHNLSSNGKIKLIFIRYDENRRDAVPQNLADVLAKKKYVPTQKQ